VHLADGVVSQLPLVVASNLLGACGVGAACARAFDGDRRGVTWTGTLAAFVLAAQALNVPLVPGASAHAIGAGLLCFALGPARAIVAMFAVLLVQALLFADGGITVLGINALTMAVLPISTVALFRRLLPRSPAGAAWLGTLTGNTLGALVLSSLLVAGAGTPAALTFGWLLGVQALAALVEGALTALAVRRLAARAPALLNGPGQRGLPLALDELPASEPRGVWAFRAAALALVLTVALLPLASSRPDALEVVLEHLQATP
jgi:cobalt/nickel transport system permease protein